MNAASRNLQSTCMLNTRAAEVQAACCNGPAEDCSSGAPASCNAGCAATFLPFWTDCSQQLGSTANQYLNVVHMCRNAVGCGLDAMANMTFLCCEGHRRMQDGIGCAALMHNCTIECKAVYLPLYQKCASAMGWYASPEYSSFAAQCAAPRSQPHPEPEPEPSPPLVCNDSSTWVSNVDHVGCSQYAPGATSWQSMCAAHIGFEYNQATAHHAMHSSGGTLGGVQPMSAAQACPVACGTCPTCTDGKQNGDETGVDCGGSCQHCIRASSCGPIESSGLLGANVHAICTGTTAGSTCLARPAVGHRVSSPGTAAELCAASNSTPSGSATQLAQECAAQAATMFTPPPRTALPGHFTCTSTGQWEGDRLHVLPIIAGACPPQLVGQHYSATCDPAARQCVPQCDAGYPPVRGDGVFTCRNGVWVGDLVCEPISCGTTLDNMPLADSAFSVCTQGHHLGDTCTARCREGFYSTVGTGSASFKCMQTGGGLWMQQGFSPWWESSLQCTRCPTIEHCVVSSCTTGNDAQCLACATNFYSYRHDETPTRCLPTSVTLQAAGFHSSATGIFTCLFSGTLGIDFRDHRVTTTISATVSLSLTGTHVEPVAMNFQVTGGVLQLRSLNIVGSTLHATTVGQIVVHDCLGGLGDITIDDSTLVVTGAPQGLGISRAISLSSAGNVRAVQITGVTFSDVSLSVSSSTLHIMSSGGSFTNIRAVSSRLELDAVPMTFRGTVTIDRCTTVNFTNKTFSDVSLSVSSSTLHIMSSGGNFTNIRAVSSRLELNAVPMTFRGTVTIDRYTTV
eukprot:COSAG01_NODE_9322_length_2484_cov_1.684696_1_plen_794_part_01